MPDIAEITITHIGHQGDGLGQLQSLGQDKPIAIPLTLPGEIVRAEIQAGKEPLQGRILEITAPSPQRAIPPCPVFGICGGCRLQHMKQDAYREWKRGMVNHLLAKSGFFVRVEDIFFTPPASRRRASLVAKKEDGKMLLGFHARESHAVVSVEHCAVLKPQLSSLLPALRDILGTVLDDGQSLTAHITLLRGAIEIVLSGHRFSDTQSEKLTLWASAQNITRLYTRIDENSENRILLSRHTFTARYGEHEVELPPHAFMQASDEAEAAMVAFVKPMLAGARHIADLFCGTGLFALSVHDKNKTMLAVDADGTAIHLLHHATQNLRGFKTMRRNLFREPLKAIELKTLDALCLDPPRAGAKEQCAEIVRTKIKTVVYVSCNSATFLRDAKILEGGGYTLKTVRAFDQFLWSQHVELIGLFVR